MSREQTTYRATGSTQKVTPGASTQIAALPDSTTIIRVYADTLCYFEMDKAATNSSVPIPAGIPEYFSVNEDDRPYIFGTGGNLWITPMTQ